MGTVYLEELLLVDEVVREPCPYNGVMVVVELELFWPTETERPLPPARMPYPPELLWVE